MYLAVHCGHPTGASHTSGVKYSSQSNSDSKYIRLRFCHTSADVVVQGIIYNQSISNLNTGTVHLKFTLCSHDS